MLPSTGLATQLRSLLPKAEAVVAGRWRPGGQNGERLLARWASAAPHPDVIVSLVMSLLAAAAVTNDRVLAANRTAARQLRQLDLSYPGSALSSVHGSAIKRINGWREGPPRLTAKFDPATGLHPPVTDQCRTKKESAHPGSKLTALTADWPVIRDKAGSIAERPDSGRAAGPKYESATIHSR